MPIQKSDYLLATQSLKFAQQFGLDFVPVAGYDVILYFIGAGPLERAEWASASWPVYVLSMPLEFLDPSKLSVARCTGRFHLETHATVTAVSGILGCWIFPSSQRLSLGRINMQSIHGQPDGACLVGWEIVLRAQLDAGRNRGHWKSVVEVQRSRGSISMVRC